MDSLTMLQEAWSAGLIVVANGDRLVVRGPRSAEAIARRLIENKPEIMAALTARDARTTTGNQPEDAVEGFETFAEFGDPCQKCDSLEKWWGIVGRPHCQHCEADRLQRSRDLARHARYLRSKGSKSSRHSAR